MASKFGKVLPAQSNLTNLILPHVSKCYPGTGSTVIDLASKDEYTFFSPDGSDIVTGGDDSLLSIATENASSGFFTFNRVHNPGYSGQRKWMKHSGPFNLTESGQIDGTSYSDINPYGYPKGKIALNASSLILSGTDDQGKDPECCMMIWMNVPNFIGELALFHVQANAYDGANQNENWSELKFHARNHNNHDQWSFDSEDYDSLNVNNPHFILLRSGRFTKSTGVRGQEAFRVQKDDWVCLFVNRSRVDLGNQGANGDSDTDYDPGGSGSGVQTGAQANYYSIQTHMQILAGRKYNSPLQNKTETIRVSADLTGSNRFKASKEDQLIDDKDIPGDLPFNSIGSEFWGHVGVIAKWDRALSQEEIRKAYDVYRSIYDKPEATQRTYKCQIIDGDGFPIIDSQNQSINTNDLNLSTAEFEIGL